MIASFIFRRNKTIIYLSLAMSAVFGADPSALAWASIFFRFRALSTEPVDGF